MKGMFTNALVSVRSVREKLFFRIMWYVMTVLVVVWSVLAGLQLAVNSSIIENNSKIVSASNKAVGIDSTEDGYLILSNQEKVKEDSIKEYVKTKPGMLPRYLGDNMVSQPLTVQRAIGYSIQFASLVLTSYFCMMVCNWVAGVLKKWKRVLLRMLYIVLTIGYFVVGIVYSSMFSYIHDRAMYLVCIGVGGVLFILFDFCMFSIKLEGKDVSEE